MERIQTNLHNEDDTYSSRKLDKCPYELDKSPYNEFDNHAMKLKNV